MRATRKTIAIASATGALLFGGAGVANAELPGVPTSTTTTVAQEDYGNNNDNTGLWGLAGLLGLLGLTGLKRRNHDDYRTGTTAGAMRGSGTTNPTNRGTPPPTV